MGDLLKAFGEFWIDLILLVPRLIYAGTLSILESALEFFPQSQIVDPASFYGSFGSDLIWMLTVFEVPFGLSLLMSVMVGRFILRRLPLVG